MMTKKIEDFIREDYARLMVELLKEIGKAEVKYEEGFPFTLYLFMSTKKIEEGTNVESFVESLKEAFKTIKSKSFTKSIEDYHLESSNFFFLKKIEKPSQNEGQGKTIFSIDVTLSETEQPLAKGSMDPLWKSTGLIAFHKTKMVYLLFYKGHSPFQRRFSDKFELSRQFNIDFLLNKK